MRKQALIFCLLCLPLYTYAQVSGVVPLANNFLYRGIENPIKVIVEGYLCDSIEVSGSMPISRIRACEYSVIPMNESYGYIKVSVYKKGFWSNIGRHDFRILTIPDPVAKIEGSYDGRISIGVLTRARGITADLDDFIYEVDFKIKSFTALIEKRDSIIYEEDVTGELFPASLSASFREIHPLDRVIFENIIAVGPDEIEREIDPLSLTIK